jgi:S-formylglutathione hydrolase
MKIVSEAKAHGGRQGVYTTSSQACGCDMTFAVFTPPQAKEQLCPVVWYLSGLTCTHANVMDKGEYRRLAAELGLIIVCPDVSPRGDHVPESPTTGSLARVRGSISMRPRRHGPATTRWKPISWKNCRR